MAVTQYGVNHPMAVKTWSPVLTVEALKRTSFYHLIGKTPYSPIHIKDLLQKGPGDQITYGLRMQLEGEGRQGSEVQEGHEEDLDVFTDAVVINTLRHAARSDSDSSISQQRVPFNIREHMVDGLADWWAERWDTSWINQMCGYTPEARTKFTGNQAVVAPDADHIFRQASRVNDESLLSGDTFSLGMIDVAVERAETLDPPIRKADLGNGLKMYVCVLHTYQRTDLRRDAETAGNWFDIQQSAMQGGDVSGNPIFTGALGVYNDTLLLCNSRITQGVDSSSGAPVANTRRAVFLGAQAGALAFGRNHGPSKLQWKEKFFDYEEQLGVQSKSIFGLKKCRFNSKDFASIVMTSYAAAH